MKALRELSRYGRNHETVTHGLEGRCSIQFVKKGEEVITRERYMKGFQTQCWLNNIRYTL